jgi:uncharacterized membrane protein
VSFGPAWLLFLVMRPVVFNEIPLESSASAFLARGLRWTLFVLFLVQFCIVMARQLMPAPPFGPAHWPEGVFLVLAAATTLASLGRQLPTQNLMLASLIIAGIGCGAHILTVLTGIPFGPCHFTPAYGPMLFNPVPWPIPFVWLVIILNSREVARLVLRPYRRSNAYGYWVIGITIVLALLMDLVFEPFGVNIMHYWIWGAIRIHLDWYHTPFINFLAWIITSLIILAFATPSLINKRPFRLAPDLRPLIVYVLLLLWFGVGEAHEQLWGAAALGGVVALAASGFAIRGAKEN